MLTLHPNMVKIKYIYIIIAMDNVLIYEIGSKIMHIFQSYEYLSWRKKR